MTAEAAAVQVRKIVGGLFRLEHYCLPGVETKLIKIVYSDNQNISIWNGASLSHDFTSKKKKKRANRVAAFAWCLYSPVVSALKHTLSKSSSAQ